VLIKNIPVNRKKRNDLKNLEVDKNSSNKNVTLHKYNDLPIIPGIKYHGIKSSDRIETLKYIIDFEKFLFAYYLLKIIY